MQQPPVLQSIPLGTRLPSEESVASIQASQRDWLKPSEVKVSDRFYRYENRLVSIGVDEWDEPLGSREELYCHSFDVVKVTPKGAVIVDYFRDNIHRPVMDHYINKFAFPTKGEALLGFIKRKERQQTILYRQIARAVEGKRLAERLLLKEMNQ